MGDIAHKINVPEDDIFKDKELHVAEYGTNLFLFIYYTIS
jgi:hypothetical protein